MMRSTRASLAFIREQQRARKCPSATDTEMVKLKRIPTMRVRDVLACDVHAGDTIEDTVFGSRWLVTGTDGRTLTAVNDHGHATTMRIAAGERVYVLEPL